MRTLLDGMTTGHAWELFDHRLIYCDMFSNQETYFYFQYQSTMAFKFYLNAICQIS